MEIETEVISREIIKPSSPTPNSLGNYQFSFLDQIAPPILMPLIYFYPADAKISDSDKSNRLKKSLSEALSRFHPLAGRLVDDAHVDCNDQGAPYVEAQASCSLSQAITNPIPGHMNKFLPCKLDNEQNLGMAVQITHFQCGEIAVGRLVSHKIADAASFFLFANTWAAIARNEGDIPRPKFEAPEIFPPTDVSGFKASTGMVKGEELVTKIFSFPASKIALLRERYSSGATHFPQQRVEALSTFIWTRFISAREMKHDPDKVYILLHTINVRTRLHPPLSEHHFGNISRLAVVDGPVMDVRHELLQKIQEAVNGEYVAQQLMEGDKHLNFLKERMGQANKGELVAFNFTSLCRFPLYEADFGWGKPVWVGSAGLSYKNLVTFMDTAMGDGIEAWISLSKEDVEKFEADLELQEFLSKAKTTILLHSFEIV